MVSQLHPIWSLAHVPLPPRDTSRSIWMQLISKAKGQLFIHFTPGRFVSPVSNALRHLKRRSGNSARKRALGRSSYYQPVATMLPDGVREEDARERHAPTSTGPLDTPLSGDSRQQGCPGTSTTETTNTTKKAWN